MWEEPSDPVLTAVSALVTSERPVWTGTATEMAETLHANMKPNTLTMRLYVRADALLEKFHIRYESGRTHAGRQIRLTLLPNTA